MSARRNPARSDPSRAPEAQQPAWSARQLIAFTVHALTSQRYAGPIALAVWLLDAALTLAIIRFVAYTEIDWRTYMQQVKLFLDGERDYVKIKGSTGPVVYPAGFIYVYSLFYRLTDQGRDLRLGQYIFAGVYLLTLALVLDTYRRCRSVPPLAYPLLSLSKRLHSIYVLRLFNDPVAMLFFYLSTWLLVQRRWNSASVFFSLALSIKMNILLFAPAFGLIIFKALGFGGAMANAATVLLLQLLLSLPFIVRNPHSYLHKAFDLSRVFLYKWTVNWRFLPEDVFLSRKLAIGLLVGHLLTLVVFAAMRWVRKEERGIATLVRRGWRKGIEAKTSRMSADHMMTLLFTSNLIGVLFSRSLHYQFYSWYAHQIVFLLWHTRYPSVLRLALFFAIEYAWNVFPSTSPSSGILLAAHVLMVTGIFFGYSNSVGRKAKGGVSEGREVDRGREKDA